MPSSTLSPHAGLEGLGSAARRPQGAATATGGRWWCQTAAAAAEAAAATHVPRAAAAWTGANASCVSSQKPEKDAIFFSIDLSIANDISKLVLCQRVENWLKASTYILLRFPFVVQANLVKNKNAIREIPNN